MASDHRVDLRDATAVDAVVRAVRPSVVLHLAAQPLVRDGVRDPSGTFGTNVQGTTHLLAALRSVHEQHPVDAIVVVTTDKVYEPRLEAHAEDDRLGGHDPYAWSKVMVEQVVEAFRALPALDGFAAWSIPMATARAGNVIGGGDWSGERLVPDCIRAFASNAPVRLRFPESSAHGSTSSSLCAATCSSLRHCSARTQRACPALQLRTEASDDATVGDVARLLAARWGDDATVADEVESAPLENPSLRLRSDRAQAALGWVAMVGPGRDAGRDARRVPRPRRRRRWSTDRRRADRPLRPCRRGWEHADHG
jgi:CDP-glucose 4,6-dehydratase